MYNFRRGLALYLRDRGHEVVLVTGPGPYQDRLQALGFHWVCAPVIRKSVNPFNALRVLLWLIRLMRAQKFALIHSFTIKSAIYGSLAAWWLRTPASINEVAGLGYVFISNDLKARLLRPAVRMLMRFAFSADKSRTVVQNPDDADQLVRERVTPPDRIRIVPGSGVDCTRFTPNVHASADPKKLVKVLLPARMLWDKGVAEFVEAARILRASRRDIEFLLAGEPDTSNPAAVPVHLLQEWSKSGLLQWLGHVDDMPSMLRSVDIVALPSYREGLPKGLIEAAACERALVTTDVPGCRSVVKHRENGLLVPAKDASALAHAIRELVEQPMLRRRLAIAARKRACEEFDARIVFEKTLEIYRELEPSH